MKKTLIFLSILFFFVICITPVIQIAPVNAQVLTNPLTNSTENISVEALAARVIKVVLGFVGIITLIMFIYGGLVWMTSGGAEEKIKKGKAILVWATLGLIVVLASYAITHFLISSIQNVGK